MTTMYEFSMATQTWEYIVAVAGLIAFGFFWKWLNVPVGEAARREEQES